MQDEIFQVVKAKCPSTDICIVLSNKQFIVCRRLRLIPEQLKDLKADLPPKDSEGNRPSSPVLEAQISDLEAVSLFPSHWCSTKDWSELYFGGWLQLYGSKHEADN